MADLVLINTLTTRGISNVRKHGPIPASCRRSHGNDSGNVSRDRAAAVQEGGGEVWGEPGKEESGGIDEDAAGMNLHSQQPLDDANCNRSLYNPFVCTYQHYGLSAVAGSKANGSSSLKVSPKVLRVGRRRSCLIYSHGCNQVPFLSLQS